MVSNRLILTVFRPSEIDILLVLYQEKKLVVIERLESGMSETPDHFGAEPEYLKLRLEKLPKTLDMPRWSCQQHPVLSVLNTPGFINTADTSDSAQCH